MKNQQRTRLTFNPRLMFGALLIATSFFSAYVISNSNNRMMTVWSAVNNLAPGHVIESGDVAPTKVLIPENAGLYINAESSLIGSHVLRSIGTDELIPAYALSEASEFNLKRVPISLARSRLPLGVTRGSVIDLYVTPRELLSGSIEVSRKSKSTALLFGVTVYGIDEEASKLGGDIGLTILVSPMEVGEIVAAMSVSDFVVVRNN